MAVRPISPDTNPRKRKVHKKSRLGCKNCKLRSVKCDERKPTCEKCASYGVMCTYAATSRELQLSVEGADHFTLTTEVPYWQCKSDELMKKFQVRTALTVSFGKRLSLYQKPIIDLARTNISLYHAMITLTLAHDRHLSPDPNKSPTAPQCYHWSRALSSFNKQLCHIPQGDEPAALLTTAAMLGLLSFSNIEATTPEEAWPLAPHSPSDLDWLMMSDGKKEVWKLTQQSDAEPSDLTRQLSYIYSTSVPPPSTTARLKRIDDSAPSILSVFDFDATTNTEDADDPLKWAAGRLAQTLASDGSPQATVFGFLYLISAMRPDYKQMLIDKEPRALLLLAWWFSQVSKLDLWWLTRRSFLEGQAICVYLERHYPNDVDVERLLEYPKSLFAARRLNEDYGVSPAIALWE